MVAGVGVDIGNVEQQQRISLLQQLRQELGLSYLGFRPLDQGGDVFERQRQGQRLPGRQHVFGHDLQ